MIMPFICGLCLPLQVDCKNYIRLLQFLDDERIYVCGTYAFDPQCAFLVSVTFADHYSQLYQRERIQMGQRLKRKENSIHPVIQC